MIIKKNEQLPSKPRIPGYLYIIPMGKDTLQCRTGGRVTALKGKAVSELIPKLLPYLNGKNSIPEIVERLKEFGENNVTAAIQALNSRGLLVDDAVEPSYDISPPEIERYERRFNFFSHYSEDKYQPQGLLMDSRVLVIGTGEIGIQVILSLIESGVGKVKTVGSGMVQRRELGSFFREMDVGKLKSEVFRERGPHFNPNVELESVDLVLTSAREVETIIEDTDLVVVCWDNPAVSIFEWVNKACLKKKIRWTSVGLNGIEMIMGPSIIPYETACFSCYSLRRKANEVFYHEYLAFENYLRENPSSAVDYGALIPSSKIAANICAFEIIGILSNYVIPISYGKLITLDLLNFEASIQDVLKIPLCPDCSQAGPKPKRWVDE